MPRQSVRKSFCKKGERASSQLIKILLLVVAIATMGFCCQHWRRLWEVSISFAALKSSLQKKMSAPSRSHSSARGEEGYFEWRANIKRRQRESERQMQALLQETRRLREENVVLRIQVSSEPLPCQRPRSLRYDQEAMYPGNVSLPLETCDAWLAKEPIPARRMP